MWIVFLVVARVNYEINHLEEIVCHITSQGMYNWVLYIPMVLKGDTSPTLKFDSNNNSKTPNLNVDFSRIIAGILQLVYHMANPYQ